MILGHSNEKILNSVKNKIDFGTLLEFQLNWKPKLQNCVLKWFQILIKLDLSILELKLV